MQTEKPQEPRPKDFGLTEERILKFKNPFFELLEGPAFLIPLGVISLGGAIWVWDRTNSLGVTLGSVPFLLFGALVIGALGTAVAESIWCRIQPDYQKFRNYRTAEEAYGVKLREWIRTQEAWWQSLDGRTFEVELARLFQNRGYRVQWTGKSGDQGVDLIVMREGRQRIIVQCKAHKVPVGPAPVRDLYGTLVHRGEKEAWLVSSSGFSKAAREFAMNKPIRLLSIREILQRE